MDPSLAFSWDTACWCLSLDGAGSHWLRAGREPPWWWCSRTHFGPFPAVRGPRVVKLDLHLLFLVIQYHNALNALKRTSPRSLHFQPLYFGSSSSFLRTTVTLCLLPQQREVISLYFSRFTPLWPKKKKLTGLLKGLQGVTLAVVWRSDGRIQQPHLRLFTEGIVLRIIVLCKLLGRSTASPPQGWWEVHHLPLRRVAVKLMWPYGSRLQILTV